MLVRRSGLIELLTCTVEKNTIGLFGAPGASRIDPLVASPATIDGKPHGFIGLDTQGGPVAAPTNKPDGLDAHFLV